MLRKPHFATVPTGIQLPRLSLLLWLFPALPAAAADSVLPEVTVSGDRIEQLEEKYPDLQADHALNPYRVAPSSRLSVQTFTAEDIETIKPQDIFDLLNHSVGVLTLYQGRKVPYSVRIRGDLYFGYIIDGVYIPSEAGGRILQNLPLSAIEQIDIVRDATALTLAPMVDFGRPSGSPNDGYIIIRTRRPLGNEATAGARRETYDTNSRHLFAGAANKDVYASGLVTYYDTEGRGGEYMAKHSESGMFRTGYTGSTFRAEFSAFRDETTQQIQAADPRESTLGFQRWSLEPINTTFLALNLSNRWNADNTTTLTVSSYRLTATMIAGSSLPGILPNIYPNEEKIDNVDLKHTLRFDDTLIRIGGQHMRWNTPTGASYYEGYPREEIIKGYFATLEQGFFERKVIADIAVRQDQQFVVRGVDHYYAYQMVFQQPTIFNRSLPPSRYLSLGVAYSPTPDWKINTRGYVAEQGAAANIPALDNKILDPEKQRKAEIGLAYAGWSYLRPALTMFYTNIRNSKYPAKEARSATGLTTSLWDQRDLTRTGFELVGKGEIEMFGGLTEYSAGWTYLTGDVTNEDYGRTSPRNTFALTVKHRNGPWEGAVSLSSVDRFASDWKATDGRFHDIGDYSRVDLNVGRRFQLGPTAARISLFGRNLLDQRYETQLGFRDIGRIWGTEVQLDL
jgi:iron complex outermembrane receptor protein